MEKEIEIIVRVNCVDNDISAAKILINDKDAKHIRSLSRKAGESGTMKEWNGYPEFGSSSLDLENDPVRLLEDTVEDEEDPFKEDTNIRVDCTELNVDSDHFWWSGNLKHSDIQWETVQIPLECLPLPEPKPSLVKDLNQTPEQRTEILTAIFTGVNHGLNYREVTKTLPKWVTKAHLVALIAYNQKNF